MTYALTLVVALLFTCPFQQPAPPPQFDIPLRISWSPVNPDGYTTVKFVNDSEMMITAWALGISRVRTDGTTSPSYSSMDAFGSLIIARLGRGPATSGPLLRAKSTYSQAVRVDEPGRVQDFSLWVSAVVFEDGSIAGDRNAVSRLLAAREADAGVCGEWAEAFKTARVSSDRETAVATLQHAVDGGISSARTALSLKNLAQRAIGQRGNDSAFVAAVLEGARTARACAIEGLRHTQR